MVGVAAFSQIYQQLSGQLPRTWWSLSSGMWESCEMTTELISSSCSKHRSNQVSLWPWAETSTMSFQT